MPLPVPIAFAHLLGNYEFHTSNYVMFVYDHMLTFGEEVEKIWSRPFTLPTLLFYLNRYVTHFQYIVIQVAFHETTWSDSMYAFYLKLLSESITVDLKVSTLREVCRSIYYFTRCRTQFSRVNTVAELIMILRVYALYLGNKMILVFLLCLLAGQVIVSGWAVHNGMRVPQPHGFPGCVLTGKKSFFAALWGAPLVTDSCIFFLTLWRTIRYMRKHGRMTAMEIMLRDGTLYFIVIFGVNLMNTLIYFLALGDLKAVGASFSQILTSIMISRLQLNLRYTPTSPDTARVPKLDPMFSPQGTNGSSRMSPSVIFTTIIDTDYTNSQPSSRDEKSFFTVGNLGAELLGPLGKDDLSETSASQTAIEAENVELGDSPSSQGRDGGLYVEYQESP